MHIVALGHLSKAAQVAFYQKFDSDLPLFFHNASILNFENEAFTVAAEEMATTPEKVVEAISAREAEALSRHLEALGFDQIAGFVISEQTADATGVFDEMADKTGVILSRDIPRAIWQNGSYWIGTFPELSDPPQTEAELLADLIAAREELDNL